MAFKALPGFRDFYPEEMAVRRHVEQAWHEAAQAAGFCELDGPPLESLELLKAKSGDAIVEQVYAFTDKGGREVGLRPELTPTVARMVAARAQALKKPVKWYAVPQLFRYERQQRGRLREHIQFNVDIFGASEIAADAEVLAVALDALQRLDLTAEEIYVRVSHKAVVESKLQDLQCSDVATALHLIDKGLLDAERTADILTAPALKELEAWLDERKEPEGDLAEFFNACGDYGVGEFLELDKRIVRGLAYYTGVVWEIFDRKRTLRAVAGGGRYDTLIERLGGPAMPALGFGMGDVVTSELLEELGKTPEQPPRLDAYVIPIGEGMLAPARQVAARLRACDVCAEAPFSPLKVGKAFRAAEAAGAVLAYLVGPDEWKDGQVKRRNLDSGEEELVDVESLP